LAEEDRGAVEAGVGADSAVAAALAVVVGLADSAGVAPVAAGLAAAGSNEDANGS
jgi:hypothetical protein